MWQLAEGCHGHAMAGGTRSQGGNGCSLGTSSAQASGSTFLSEAVEQRWVLLFNSLFSSFLSPNDHSSKNDTFQNSRRTQGATAATKLSRRMHVSVCICLGQKDSQSPNQGDGRLIPNCHSQPVGKEMEIAVQHCLLAGLPWPLLSDRFGAEGRAAASERRRLGVGGRPDTGAGAQRE